MKAVLQRELRAQARTGRPWLLRGGVALAAVVFLGTVGVMDSSLFAGSGHRAFYGLNYGCVAGLVILCPAITSDLVSRERREGTLGLLFMTPLRPRDIVLGKAASGLVRAVSAWLAVAPVLFLPILQGGVELGEAAAMIALEAAVMMLALASGLVASSWSRQSWHALLVSYVIFGMLFLVVGLPSAAIAIALAENLRPGASREWLDAGLTLVVAGLAAVGLVVFAGQEASLSWREESFYDDLATAGNAPPTSVEVGTSRSGSTLAEDPTRPKDELVSRSFPSAAWWERWMATQRIRLRESDPLRWWLRRGTDAVVPVGLLLFFVLCWITLVMASHRPPQVAAWGLMGVAVLRAPALFREERRSGLFEILLASPVAPDLPAAAARTLWWDLGPAVVLHGIGCWVIGRFWPSGWWEGAVFPLAAGVFVAPALGLWSGWLFRGPVLSALSTGVVGFLGPMFLGNVAVRLWETTRHRWLADEVREPAILAVTVLLQLVLGALAYRWVRQELTWRERVTRPL